jgi:Protein kinase domain
LLPTLHWASHRLCRVPPPRPMRAAALVLLVAARAACRTLTGGDLPRYANQPDRLPPVAALDAADVPLGTVTVTVAGKNVTDNNALRAAILSGMASATDWLSVDDVAAIDVVATETAGTSTVPTESTPCGTSGPSLTYTIALAPAVLPTATQARQLVDGASKSIGTELARLKYHRVAATDVRLDATLYAARPAPFPVNAQAGSDNVLTGWLRSAGYGMNLCDAGLAALRNMRRRYLVDWVKTADARAKLVGSTPSGRHNLANTRFVNVVPLLSVNKTLFSVDPTPYLKGGGANVLDMQVAIAGLTREQAANEALNITRLAPELARFMEPTPGLSEAKVQSTDAPWLYNGRNIAGDPISTGALAAAIVVPTLAALALATAGGIFVVRRRRRARERAAKVAVLAANGLGSAGSAGSGKPSELLRAIADAAPAASDPLARLAAVDWEVDPADLAVSTGDDGEEVELGIGASGRVIRGRYKKTGHDVAIKILTKRDDGGRGLEELAKEIVMLRACRHPNIVSFVGASIRDGVPPILVVELMPRGDLYRALENPRLSSVFQWRRVMEGGRPRRFTGMNRRVALDISRGLSYLHSLGIMHLDVKSVNILLNSDFTAKLADVGAARALGDKASATLTSPVGTLAWMSPEVLMGERVS